MHAYAFTCSAQATMRMPCPCLLKHMHILHTHHAQCPHTSPMKASAGMAPRRWSKPVPHAGAACRCCTAWSHAMRCADGRDGAKLRREAVNSNAEPMAPLPPGGDA